MRSSRSKDEASAARTKNYPLQAGIVLISAALIAVVFRFFSLAPAVGANFFFSTDNPSLLNSKFLAKMFPGQPTMIVLNVEGGIDSDIYLRKIWTMTNDLKNLGEVKNILSLSHGPGSADEALASPLWRRLLVTEAGKSSNIIVFLKDLGAGGISPVIKKIEKIAYSYKTDNKNVRISGIPYTTEMIRRNLFYDLRVFSSLACVLFGAVILVMFRSLSIFIGTLCAAASAAAATIIGGGLVGAQIGILTANIITIVFVLTLSHIVYLTHNWTEAREEAGAPEAPALAVKKTFTASVWCMATTFLGFASLLLVQAKPLKELGTYGLFGTLSAIAAAYIFYPVFLRTARPHASHVDKNRIAERLGKQLFRRSTVISIGLLALALAAIPGVFMLNTDPSLMVYFKKGSELREGLELLDANGGSTPLSIALRDASGRKITHPENYERLWTLQRRLESDESVGSILSFPIILAEGRRYALGSLFTLRGLARLLWLPAFDQLSRPFVTGDRITTHFFMRMREAERAEERETIAKRLEGIVRDYGFIPEVTAGLYLLQGEMSELVAGSIITGIRRLLFFFFLMAIFMSRSFRVAFAMIISIGAIPVIIFGTVGLLRVQVDLISAPAANIAIALGIDSMIHFVIYAGRKSPGRGVRQKKVWKQTQRSMRSPVFNEAVIICMGFAIFLFSSFPPTARFGIEIIYGTLISALATLFALPFLAKLFFRITPTRKAPRTG